MNNRSSANITRENISQDNVLLAYNMAERTVKIYGF